ncbi:glutaminyl-peptide cyclotransferase [Anaeramoeba ignava]|uniref:Glutaminyl-peptide cyclotransferase n=1 Tax=Anaeramoeba ignava TaxID=1746090 RepID=A0A9Q0RAM0_ANAIG|nr:glutaminyl-peptide cyclotransferase [Anaeramoeba ignava]|eukprot:Anaeramoba_ignava/a218577_31.p1 GENE.a218577_31~~a218577_31.p1  ORF type:complete len:358 (-),score=95.41 a218577_31:60-1133(-)
MNKRLRLYAILGIFFIIALTRILLTSKNETPQKKQTQKKQPTQKQQFPFNIIQHEKLSYNEFMKHFNVIGQKRVPGTKSHKQIENYIIGHFEKLQWHFEEDVFTSKTILGEIEFRNLIFTLNLNHKIENDAPFPQENTMVFAVHYDSKYFADIDNFIGAIDSAAPCAIYLQIAEYYTFLFRNSQFKHLFSKQSYITQIQFIFFDGEESFGKWSASDSLYGSRHLAEKFKQQNRLSYMKIFMLLDLFGHKLDSPLKYYFDSTSVFHQQFVLIENFLREHNLNALPKERPLFSDKKADGMIEDDHIPFLQNQIPCVHLIPDKFPEFWHTEKDNLDVIDPNSVVDLVKILVLLFLQITTK